MTSNCKNISVWIHGLSGRMGTEIKNYLNSEKDFFTFIGGSSQESKLEDSQGEINKADLILDFSSNEGNKELLNYIKKSRIENFKILIGSTGLNEEQVKAWKDYTNASRSTCLFAPNTSLGIILILKATLSIANISLNEGFDIEIEETHHRNKIDSPSGTANYLSNEIAKETNLTSTFQESGKRKDKTLGVHAIRGGGVFGEHKIRILGDHEEISINHRAFSRTLFVKGAMFLSKWLVNQKSGVYSISDVSSQLI